MEISTYLYDENEYVIVASGDDFPDALVGGTLSGQIQAPILLVGKNYVPTEVLQEIERLSPKKIYILGGTGTISPKSGDILKTTNIPVERIYGKDRLATAMEIGRLRYKYAEHVAPGNYIAVVDGKNFPDALAAAPFIARIEPLTYLYPYTISFDKPYSLAIGGKNSVPTGIAEQFRIAGKNRIDTAVEIAKAYEENIYIELNTVVLVNGMDFPDALASSALATKRNGAILLTESNILSKESKKFIENNSNIENIIIIGGENSVSRNVIEELEKIGR